jgi:hypothetical protein
MEPGTSFMSTKTTGLIAPSAYSCTDTEYWVTVFPTEFGIALPNGLSHSSTALSKPKLLTAKFLTAVGLTLGRIVYAIVTYVEEDNQHID